jgi:hypothetical protein
MSPKRQRNDARISDAQLLYTEHTTVNVFIVIEKFRSFRREDKEKKGAVNRMKLIIMQIKMHLGTGLNITSFGIAAYRDLYQHVHT